MKNLFFTIASTPFTFALSILLLPPQAFAQDLAMGQKVYEKTCYECHDSGKDKAPRLGNYNDWKKHLKEGLDHLSEVAIEGEGKMPPRGGNPDLTDEEVKSAVAYMLAQIDKSKNIKAPQTKKAKEGL